MTTIALAVVAAALAGLAVRRWLVGPARVESASMEPTLLPGRRLVVRRVGVGRLGRGDVVLVRPDEVGRVVVKRVIGLPGERIDLDDAGGVRVDGNRIAEPYARPGAGPAISYQVPRGTLFLLGDNRRVSSDSRTWQQPYVPARALVGRVVGGGGRPRT